MTDDNNQATCYRCGSTHIEAKSVSRTTISHKGVHIKCLNPICRAEKFYPDH